MNLFFDSIKGQFNSLNFFLCLMGVGFLLQHFKNTRSSKFVFLFGVLFFLLTSTAYLPRYLVSCRESVYPPFNRSQYFYSGDSIYIHSLGGGYTADSSLPPAAQLSLSSLGRLAESIRIARMFERSIIVVSGNVTSGEEILASVERRAVIGLGFDSTRIITLVTPSTTHQEAEAFVERFGKQVDLILVTDATHMLRAMNFFKEQGITPFPAPTNFLIKTERNAFDFGWIPSVENLQLMDRVWREYLGVLKGKFVNPKPETTQH